MKRFVICLDGTWNHAAKETERKDKRTQGHPGEGKVFKPTNVLKVARATEQADTHGNQQVTYYDAGVGAMNRAPNVRTKIVRWFDNKLGGGWGAGFEVNIEEAYTFLAHNYCPGDEIFVFGFSRGASQARSLVNLIRFVGGFPTKNDAYYVPKLFTAYLEERGEGTQTLWKTMNAKRQAAGRRLLDDIVPARIEFLGIWDTVLALGMRLGAKGGSSAPQHRFHTPDQPSPIVDRTRHALAIDERRHDFQPEIYATNSHSPALEQRWFPGVHSNVGGGLLFDGLANGALDWICDEAELAGLALNRPFIDRYRKYPQDKASKKTAFYKIGDFVFSAIRGFRGIRSMAAAAFMTIDDSVFHRLNELDLKKHDRLGGLYRPDNLLRHLAENPQYDPKLKPHVLAIVQKMR